MAIDVNRFDSGALAALAGNSTPNYNLPLHGITGGDFFKELVAQNNASRGMDIQQQQVNQQGAYQQGELANQQQQLALAKQNSDRQQAQFDLAARTQQKKEDLETRLQFGSNVFLAQQQIASDSTLDPATKQQKLTQLQQDVAKSGEDQGILSHEEAEAYRKATPQQASFMLMHDMKMNDIALKMQQAQNQTGTQIQFDPATGNPISVTTTPSKTTTESAQKDVQNTNQQVSTLSEIAKNYEAALFTGEGKLKSWAGTWMEYSPTLSAIVDKIPAAASYKKEALELADKQAALKQSMDDLRMTALQGKNGARFNAASLEALESHVLSAKTPQEFEAQLGAYTNYLNKYGDIATAAATKGVDVTPGKNTGSLQSTLQTVHDKNAASSTSPSSSPSNATYNLRGNSGKVGTYTDEQVTAAAQAHGMTKDEFLKSREVK